MENGAKRPGFDFTTCKNVSINNNIFELPEVPLIKVKAMSNKDLKTDSKQAILKIE